MKAKERGRKTSESSIQKTRLDTLLLGCPEGSLNSKSSHLVVVVVVFFFFFLFFFFSFFSFNYNCSGTPSPRVATSSTLSFLLPLGLPARLPLPEISFPRLPLVPATS